MMWFFAALFFIPGAIGGAIALRHLIRAKQSERWPAVEATILSSGVEESSGDGGTSFGPAVRFAYSVDGRAYESTRILLGLPLSASKEWADSVVARYVVGARVTAAVDPQDHRYCVLERGVHGLHWGAFAFFGVFVAVGCYAFSIAIGWMRG